MKIALVHDHLNQLGGAERVLRVFCEIYPKAPIYTLIYDEKKTKSVFKDRIINQSFISKFPLSKKKFRWYLPLMHAATEGYDLSNYDIVLSDSSGMAKGVITGQETLHICYCHTPTRYLWSDHNLIIDNLERIKSVGRLSQIFRGYLRVWDRLAADRVDKFIANSKFVASRIKKYYRRESEVIYPSVEINSFYISDKIEDYFLLISRLRPYKRVDIVISAFNKLGLSLKIIGIGEEERQLRKEAKDNIEFLGQVDDKQKNYYLSRCKALIHPQEEDFGITPIEAMASGRPVIAFGGGGAIETIIDKKTGILFDEQSWEALADTIIRFKQQNFDPVFIRNHAKQFDIFLFKQKIKEFVDKSWQEFKNII